MENNEAQMEKQPARPIHQAEVLEPEPVEPLEMDETDLLDESSLAEMMPTLTVNAAPVEQPEEPCIISDANILGLYDEIEDNCRKDREKAAELLATFVDMVINDGDASSASKEAVVNLLKIQSEVNDKLAKVADLKTRIKLKERDTFPRYLAQHNNVTIESSNSKRDLLKALSKKKGGK